MPLPVDDFSQDRLLARSTSRARSTLDKFDLPHEMATVIERSLRDTSDDKPETAQFAA